MKTLSEGDLLAILNKYNRAAKHEPRNTNDILAAMKEACNKMVDLSADKVPDFGSPEATKESILNLKIK